MGAVRPFLVLLALACALGALAFALLGQGAKPRATVSDGPLTTPVEGPEPAPDAPPVAEHGASEDTLLAEGAPQYAPRVTEGPPRPPPRGAPMAFEGDVYLELEGPALLPGVNGHFRLRLLVGGAFEELEVPVVNGRFSSSVPDRSLLTLLEGELNGEEVRFAESTKAFEPRPSRMALVGRPRPNQTLRVLAAGTGADLADVTLREVDGPGGAQLAAGPRAGAGEARPAPAAPLLTGATSPVRVPWVATRRPLWLEVSAPGYAPARALVDPRASGERTFELLPAAGALTVHVTGPGRGRVEGLVLQRIEADDRRPIAAHFVCTPQGPTAPDPVVFEVEGLAAARHGVRVTRLDRAVMGGVVRDLAASEVDLLVGASARLVLVVPLP
jgi:hypothetical protein